MRKYQLSTGQQCHTFCERNNRNHYQSLEILNDTLGNVGSCNNASFGVKTLIKNQDYLIKRDKTIIYSEEPIENMKCNFLDKNTLNFSPSQAIFLKSLRGKKGKQRLYLQISIYGCHFSKCRDYLVTLAQIFHNISTTSV